MNLKTKIINSILTLVLIVLSHNILVAQKYVAKDGSAFFKAKTSVTSYTGTSKQLQGYIDFQSNIIEFILPAKSINTGNKSRDKHMYELLKVEENINVLFKGKLIDEFDINKVEKQTLKVKGEFTLAGTSKDIEIEIDLTNKQNGLYLQADWTLLITDYNLKRPTKAFIKVKDEHQLHINILLAKD